MFPTAGLRQPLLVRESAAVQYVRFSVSSDKINVKTSFGRQPCNRCVSQLWVRCVHHGRFTKILGSAWIAPNWVGCAHHDRFKKIVESAWIALNCVRCAHRGRFTPTALSWRRRFARAGGPHALHVLFHTVGLRRSLRGWLHSPGVDSPHADCLRSAYAGRYWSWRHWRLKGNRSRSRWRSVPRIGHTCWRGSEWNNDTIAAAG
jgi:hypothetical protein